MALLVTQYVDHHVLGDEVGILCGLYYLLLVLMVPTYPEGKRWNWNSVPQVKQVLVMLRLETENARDETLARIDHDFVHLLREYKKRAALPLSRGGGAALRRCCRVGDRRPDVSELKADRGGQGPDGVRLPNLLRPSRTASGTTRPSRLLRAGYSLRPTTAKSNSGSQPSCRTSP